MHHGGIVSGVTSKSCDPDSLEQRIHVVQIVIIDDTWKYLDHVPSRHPLELSFADNFEANAEHGATRQDNT